MNPNLDFATLEEMRERATTDHLKDYLRKHGVSPGRLPKPLLIEKIAEMRRMQGGVDLSRFDRMDYKELREVAKTMGLEVKGRPSLASLREKVKEKASGVPVKKERRKSPSSTERRKSPARRPTRDELLKLVMESEEEDIKREVEAAEKHRQTRPLSPTEKKLESVISKADRKLSPVQLRAITEAVGEYFDKNCAPVAEKRERAISPIRSPLKRLVEPISPRRLAGLSPRRRIEIAPQRIDIFSEDLYNRALILLTATPARVINLDALDDPLAFQIIDILRNPPYGYRLNNVTSRDFLKRMMAAGMDITALLNAMTHIYLDDELVAFLMIHSEYLSQFLKVRDKVSRVQVYDNGYRAWAANVFG